MSKLNLQHGMEGTREYSTWRAMIQRCEYPRDIGYANYGGRGISVCDRWRGSFENFYADMGNKPKGLTIDRIDVNGNYEPSNCRWVNYKTQGRNRRNNRLLTLNGETFCLAEWAEKLSISKITIDARLRAGWSVEKALTHPIEKRYSHSWNRKENRRSFSVDKVSTPEATTEVKEG